MTPQDMKKRRQELGLTQIEVAIAVGVSVPAYRLWEAGGTRPTPDNEARLKEVLGGVTHEAATDKAASGDR